MKILVYSIPHAAKNTQCTYLNIDGIDYAADNKRFSSYVAKKPMALWLLPYTVRLFRWNGILAELLDAVNETDMSFAFYGLKTDYDVFRREIEAQAIRISKEYTMGIHLEMEYAGIPYSNISIDKLNRLLTLSADVLIGSAASNLLEAKRTLKKPVPALSGRWISQKEPDGNVLEKMTELGLTYGADQGLLDVLVLNDYQQIRECVSFLQENARQPWNHSLREKRVYLLHSDLRQGELDIEEIRIKMREQGYCLQHIAVVASYEDMLMDLSCYDYYGEHIFPERVGKALALLDEAFAEVSPYLSESELKEILAVVKKIKSPEQG